MSSVLRDPELAGLRHLHRGKVRDLFALPDGHLLMVASDRLSAFDVVLQDPIPRKGELLCQMSNFWFGKTAHIVRNHLTGIDVATVLPPGTELARYRRRGVVVQRLRPLPVEAIARGFVAGSGWKDYQGSGRICGIDLPPGLRLGERLREPIFTPSSKAAAGAHDENIGFDALIALIGADLAEQVRATTLAIYRFALDFAAQRGILIADTKLEFGLDADGTLVLMDELLTPDSSRFWPADSWQPGSNPPSYDKQFVRDWLEAQHWDKTPPGPRLPPEIIEGTRARYAEALARLTT